MTALLTDNLPLLAGAPNGIKKLRELVLELAVRGKLVPQDPSDEPASELLKRIAEEKARLVAEGKIKKQKALAKIGDDEKTLELPAGWAWQRFADFALDVSTGPFGSLIHQSDYVDGGIPLVNPSHMIDGRIVADQSVSLSTEMAESLVSYRLSSGDMVMARRGEVGRVALVTGAEEGWLCGTGSFVLRFTVEVSRAYVWTLFRCNSVRTYLAGAAVGTTMVNLNHSILLKMPIAVPPLPEQHRIVAKVDELMALCDRLEAQQADAESAHVQLVQALLGSLTQARDAADFAQSWQRLAEHFHTLFTTESSIDALKQTLLQLAVMGKLVPQDPSDEPASELLKRISEERAAGIAGRRSPKQTALSNIGPDEKSFELPSNWEWVRLQQIISVSSGDGLVSTSMKPEGGIPVYGGNGITGYHDQKNVDTETLVIGRVGYYCGSIHLTPTQAWITDNALRVSFSEANIYKEFLYWLLKGTNLKEQENATAQPVISGRKIYPIVLAIPPLAEQHRIVAKVDQLMALCDQLKARLNLARQVHEQLAGALVEQAVA